MTPTSSGEDLLRELAPQVLEPVARRYGDIDSAEDAVQEALLAAATQWPAEGVPDDPRGWLIAVAARRMIDRLRREEARRRREVVAASREPSDGPPPVPDRDDSLMLLFLCCHPALTPASAIPLTLRAVGGLTTAEIARAFLVPEATMAQRISRAKQRIKVSGAPFVIRSAPQTPRRAACVAPCASSRPVFYLESDGSGAPNEWLARSPPARSGGAQRSVRSYRGTS